jgi:hypothetical protein
MCDLQQTCSPTPLTFIVINDFEEEEITLRIAKPEVFQFIELKNREIIIKTNSRKLF